MDDIRVQLVNHRGGQCSYLVLDVATGSVHNHADKFLSSFCEGTQRTYAYHLVDHLRWLAVNGYHEDSIRIQDVMRYLALCAPSTTGHWEHPGVRVRWAEAHWQCERRASRATTST